MGLETPQIEGRGVRMGLGASGWGWGLLRLGVRGSEWGWGGLDGVGGSYVGMGTPEIEGRGL